VHGHIDVNQETTGMTQERDPLLTRYITRVQNQPLLTREDEIDLATRWQAHGDPAAAERLVGAHLRYVVACALRYRRYRVPLNELIAEGNFGLAHALAKFEPERGFRFVTYAAYWIRAYILDYVIRSWSMVGGGAGPLRSKLFFRLRRERVRLSNLVGEGAEAEELLGKSLGMSTSKVSNMIRRLEARDLSLDAPMYSDSARSWLDALLTDEMNQEKSLGDSELREFARSAVRTALGSLDPRERFVVEARLMAEGDEELSLAEIGRKLGVSRERARQLESRAKNKLRTAIIRLSRQSHRDWLQDVAA
jgi:RNA polymerase sigma-32 factor